MGERDDYFKPTGHALALEREFFLRLSSKRQTKLLRHPDAIHLWEADHAVAVRDGGGESALTNFQTLCLPCHAEKTKAECRRRLSKRRKKRILQQDDCSAGELPPAVVETQGPKRKRKSDDGAGGRSGCASISVSRPRWGSHVSDAWPVHEVVRKK